MLKKLFHLFLIVVSSQYLVQVSTHRTVSKLLYMKPSLNMQTLDLIKFINRSNLVLAKKCVSLLKLVVNRVGSIFPSRS